MDNYLRSKRSVTMCKRVVDISGAIIGLLVLLPILPFIMLAIRMTSPGPIFYTQLRVGKSHIDHVELFEIIKFRTMYQDAEARTGATWATNNDPRITPVGQFLRKARLDELPQLINVLRGEMSLIGPRPERPVFYQKLEENIPFFTDRTYGVLPGITGLAQVNQGYDTSIEDVRRKVGFDHGYALSQHSLASWFKTDLMITMKTFVIMLDGRGR